MAAYNSQDFQSFYASPNSTFFLKAQTGAGWGTTPSMGGTTKNYFQRVYDDGTAGYCYYTKTTIDATPSSGETTPNYTGTISDHAVVKVIVSS